MQTDNPKNSIFISSFFFTAMLSWRINYGATRALEHTDTLTSSSALEHRISADEPGTIWIVNQQKCGTNTLELSMAKALQCYEARKNVHDCLGGKKLLRFHSIEKAERLQEQFKNRMDRMGTKHQCVAITAVRDPLHSIPSRFFDINWQRFCDGTQSKKEIIKEYEQFLLGPLPPSQVDTTANMLRAFGAQDILEAMELLSEEGYTFFNQPDCNSPWAGCELLFLQIDYDDSKSNLDKGLGSVYKDAKTIERYDRTEVCPNAMENYNAVKNYRISDEQIEMYSEINPDFHDVITYYQKHYANTQRRLIH